MNLMHALWGSAQSALLGPEIRDQLKRAGVAAIQVNLDDAGVADARLRITAFDHAPDAVVTTRGGDEAATIDVLRRHADRIATWRVRESRQIEPTSTASGARAPVLAQLAFLRRPDELTQATWLDLWQGHHTAVAIETQQTFGYIQNVVVEQVAGEPLPVHGIVEELFLPEAATDVHAFYGSGGDEAELARRMTGLMASVQRFGADRDITVVPTSRYVFDL